MLFTTILASSLSALAMASPLTRRAGGPAYVPIPSDCTVLNPMPKQPATCGNGTVDGMMPSAKFVAASQIYSFYLGQPDFETINTRWEGCLEQCNGLEGCVTAFLGYSVPTPAGYYGTAGGVPSVGCLMFNTTLTPLDFVAAPAEQYVNATAGNIYCPS